MGDFLFTGAGIINSSAKLQTFDVSWIAYNYNGFPNTFNFYSSATAGELTQFTMHASPGDDDFGGELHFWDSSTAGSAIIYNLGGTRYYGGTTTYFVDESSAENAIITNEGSSDVYSNGLVLFQDNSTAGDATIINNGAVTTTGSGGAVLFRDFSSSGDSTIICKGDSVGSDRPALLAFQGAFGGSTNRGRARVVLLGNGKMDVSGGFYDLSVEIGSIEGDGNITLGDYVPVKLTVGSNNRSTNFAGIVEDNLASAGGSFTKVGTGTLSLTGDNTYTGGTTVKDGELGVNNTTGFGTGTGAVRVIGGTLSGSGTIAGAVTIGNANGPIAFLSPGGNKIGALTIQSEVTFKTASTYTYSINTNTAEADELIANGANINRGAVISIAAIGHHQLATGTVFIVIDNTATTPISGALANLRDGSTFTLAGNTLQVSYEGGDGNDLTLTVQ